MHVQGDAKGRTWTAVFFFAAALPAAAADHCAIQGKVLETGGGAPIQKASAIVSLAESTTMFQPAARSVATGTDGRFVVDTLESGRYRFTVRKDGFQQAGYGIALGGGGATVVTVSGGACVSMELGMVRLGAISGRIVDENGEPVANSLVEAVFQIYHGGVRLVGGSGKSSRTTDLGEFRIYGLAPRRFWVVAHPPEASSPRRHSGREEAYIPTTYPNVPDVFAGAPVTVSAGQTTPGLKITLRSSPVVRVRGRLVSAVRRTQAVILNLFGPGGWPHYETIAHPDGRFEFTGVVGGHYRLKATLIADGTVLSGMTEVPVGSENVGDVRVDVLSNLELHGRFQWDGRPPEGADLSKLSVTLYSSDSDRDAMVTGSIPRGNVGRDGTFRLSEVAQEEYRFAVFGLPADAYVKSISMGSVDVLNQGLSLVGGAT